ncbi:GAF domain-containing protein [Georgenia wutianyii]|uniref:GAF domain-containing protein n=1 Tax=Georgenia wutianyii TaxID=2585135 RepID=A0ABX5VQW4_9MICO|nr:GAF domain-containing protein [Georgenia wutianyii]QDB79823.1 GAF domain-containing protein [Georgenia wutianyii]
MPDRESRYRLLGAAIGLTASLDTDTVMRGFVDSAASLTGARFAALAVLDSRGETANFVFHGMDDQTAEILGHPPRGRGVLAHIPNEGHLLIESIADHPAFGGWPEGHPLMQNFLGVPVKIREQVFGRLYLADKEGGFTEDDIHAMKQLASAAAVAVVNAQRYADALDRERWVAVSQEITTQLLSGTEEEEALELIAQKVREVARADATLIVLPSIGDTWMCEIADGVGASDLIGQVFPQEGRARTVIANGVGMIVDSMSRARSLRVPALGRYGPALYAPMMAQGTGRGVLILLRLQGGQEFTNADLEVAEAVAAQAAVALELAAARHAQDVSALLEERQRISRDLHDLAIQQLFATGMQLESARQEAAAHEETAWIAPTVESALTSVDESVRQIRSIVHSLKEPDEAVGLVERLRRETSLARTGLSFAPSLVIAVDGRVVRDGDEDLSPGATPAELLDSRVDDDIADDVVAVVREGLANAARHARSSSVQVRVTVRGAGVTGRVSVEVEDDGVGVDRSSTRRSGLDNLAVRARRHGGTFSLARAESGEGTLLSWQVPLT